MLTFNTLCGMCCFCMKSWKYIHHINGRNQIVHWKQIFGGFFSCCTLNWFVTCPEKCWLQHFWLSADNLIMHWFLSNHTAKPSTLAQKNTGFETENILSNAVMIWAWFLKYTATCELAVFCGKAYTWLILFFFSAIFQIVCISHS